MQRCGQGGQADAMKAAGAIQTYGTTCGRTGLKGGLGWGLWQHAKGVATT